MQLEEKIWAVINSFSGRSKTKGMVAYMKKFLITVDTEGDNLWNPVITRTGQKKIGVKNAEYLVRFQEICEKNRFIPTYLTNYEMSQEKSFIHMARTGLKENKLEIGMHMHAWNIPPICNLPYNPQGNNPYAGEYAQKVLYQKIKYMTKTLEDMFQTPIMAHRGGRWYLDNRYVRMLMKQGYIADCTVTPGVSWSNNIGNQKGGCDYRHFPNKIYELNEHHIDREGKSGILEIPPTIISKSILNGKSNFLETVKNINFVRNQKIWLRPNGKNLKEMLYLIQESKKKSDYLEFMIHSSELMPGGSPTFTNKKAIEGLYEDLNIIFSEIHKSYEGIGVGAFAKQLLLNKNVYNRVEKGK